MQEISRIAFLHIGTESRGPEDKVELDRVWEIRNKVVHPSGKRAEREEVDVMIDIIQRICVPWEKGVRAKARNIQR